MVILLLFFIWGKNWDNWLFLFKIFWLINFWIIIFVMSFWREVIGNNLLFLIFVLIFLWLILCEMVIGLLVLLLIIIILLILFFCIKWCNKIGVIFFLFFGIKKKYVIEILVVIIVIRKRDRSDFKNLCIINNFFNIII